MSSSQLTEKSDMDLNEGTFPSPISSARSKSTSQRSSRRGSPLPTDDSNNKNAAAAKRRSNRLSALEQEQLQKQKDKERQLKEKAKEDKQKKVVTKSRKSLSAEPEEEELVLKKRKLNTNEKTNLKKEPDSKAPKNKLVSMSVKNGQLQFNEPELGDPIMSVTGLPLDTPPNSKIKKESLWPRKKGRKPKTSNNTDNEETGDDDDSVATREASLPSDNVETKLRKNLKTNEHLKKIQPSNDRSKNVKPVPKKGVEIHGKKYSKNNKNSTTVSTPKKKDPNGKSKPSKKNIKNASPKKKRENPFGFENPMDLAGQQRENAFDFNDNTKDNDDFCSSCGEPGIFLCCENCPKSFHFACCYPPLDEDLLPDGAWFCNECKAKRTPPEPNPPGLFSKLLNQVDTRNPVQFRLPKKIRERFEGVITGTYGEYEDTDYKPYRPTKIGAFEQTDPDLHFDKDGNILLCMKCGESGISPNKLNGELDKLITTCDYCSSAWHLDCLNPPLSSVKQLGKKWKCPNHADHLLPNKQRRLRKPNIVDVDQVHGFKNNGDIEVKLNEEDEEEEKIHNLPAPPFLENRDTDEGISADVPKHTMKLWNDSYAVYRIPEQGIVADFTAKVLEMREKEKQDRINELWRLNKENNLLLKNLAEGEEFSSNEKSTIKELVQLPELNVKELAAVASKELRSLNGSVKKEDLSLEELEDLLTIKKLMALKGKEKLLDFLRG